MMPGGVKFNWMCRNVSVVMLLACGPWAVAAPTTEERAPATIRPRHITPETEEAIAKGLRYLAQSQGRDGAWRNRTGYGTYPVAMTALSGLALLMSGSTTTQGPYAPNVDRATEFILGCSTETGLIARIEEADGRPMYGHGYSLLFLAELYGMTEDADRQARIAEMLRRGVQLTARSQNILGGWIYQPDSGGDEGSVTITQLQGLRACRNSGIGVPKAVIDRALRYLEMSARADGGIAYRARQPGPSRPPITAAAICCWYNAGDYKNPLIDRALRFCKQTIGRDTRLPHFFYAHLYYSQAIYLSGNEQEWDNYFPWMRDYLLKSQNEDGSWLGDGVGKPYGTALALIILQIPYNRLPIMQR
jgi:hypothetical protein